MWQLATHWPAWVKVIPVADSDDWRVTITMTGQAQAGRPQRSPSLREVEEDIRRQVGRGIAVGADEGQLFLYAGTEAAAQDAERIARGVLAQRGIAAESVLHRWHPIEERWETPDVAIPQTEAERQAEHQRLEDADTAESLATGIARWRVRVELGSHRQAVALARKLENEGRMVVRRWRFLAVGASDGDEARELAEQIKREAPPDATVIAEEGGVGWLFMPS
jgi:hypothetical protein